jgi:hypothetical protein
MSGDPRVTEALAAIRRATAEFRLLGTYARWMNDETDRTPRW